MRPSASTGERQGYATALAGLWTGLSGTLARLDEIAGGPVDRLASDETLEQLPRLQYLLHSASELAHGIEPPPGAESAHAELAAALAGARDATAEIFEAVEARGASAAERLVHEWRGALFRVRLARMRLSTAPAPPPLPPAVASARAPLGPLAIALVLIGLVAFAGGAMAGVWPVWLAGLALVVGGFATHRP